VRESNYWLHLLATAEIVPSNRLAGRAANVKANEDNDTSEKLAICHLLFEIPFL